MIKCIIFDFDGLIIDSETPEFLTWQEIYRQHAQVLSKEDWAQCVGSDFGRFDPVQHLEALCNEKFDEKALKLAQKEKSFAICSQLPLLPGVADIIHQAHDLKIPLAVASSSNAKWVVGQLNRLEILHCFNVICTSDDVARVKPAPDLFLLAAERLNSLPENCLVFEDSQLGIQAAKTAGMTAVAVPNETTRHMDFTHADLIVESLQAIVLQDLMDHFAQIKK